MRTTAVLLLILLVTSCSSTGAQPGFDGGGVSPVDGGPAADGGPIIFDAGVPGEDGGAPEDGGISTDGGALPDGGSLPDGGALPDGGTADAGLPFDAGPPTSEPACERLGSVLHATHVSSLPAFADSNYSDAEVRTVTIWPGEDGGVADESRTFMRFFTSGLQTNPAQVLLRLWVMQVGGSCQAGQVRAYRVTQNWTDSQVTWNNQPGHDEQTVWSTLAVGASTFGWVTLDITALYHEWERLGPQGNFGLVLKASCAEILNVVFASTHLSCDGVDTTAYQPTLLFNDTSCADDPTTPAPVSNVDCN